MVRRQTIARLFMSGARQLGAGSLEPGPESGVACGDILKMRPMAATNLPSSGEKRPVDGFRRPSGRVMVPLCEGNAENY